MESLVTRTRAENVEKRFSKEQNCCVGAIKVFCHNIIKNGHACLYQVASIFSIEETTSCPILRNNFNNILTRRGKEKRTTVARNYIHAFATENFYILFYKTI